jgi:hypothetical protein
MGTTAYERRSIMAKGNSKKGNFVTISGIIVVILVNLFDFNEQAAKEITTAVIGLLGAFNIGQGVADGLSGGKTSNITK